MSLKGRVKLGLPIKIRLAELGPLMDAGRIVWVENQRHILEGGELHRLDVISERRPHR
jgi:hypothetical protein